MKKNIFKKIATLSLVTLLGLGLAGCKKDEQKTNNKKNETSKAEITAENYGDKVNYTVTVNGVELNDWRIFLKDDANVYIIYGDLLPNAAIPTKTDWIYSNDRGIYSSKGRKILLDKLLTPENWQALLTEDLANKGATAVGSPTLQQFVASYNEKYTKDKFVITESGTAEDGYTEYSAIKEMTEGGIKAGLQNELEGYEDATLGRENEQKSGTLYFPQGSEKFKEYWLATPHTSNEAVRNGVVMVSRGFISQSGGITPSFARPVITISTDHLSQNSDGTWSIN